ncbi:Cell wall protein DAN4 [Cercospora beticola]|uniref:Cell wall protein DAN4 n=1 Tax=Cercospora beticola TaxID=122368 RepID=A0A2G5IB53_CERBT|nr:Cell wall protein DAN4 [Cercospora beticola]PIB02001.1 Cell wall protein DAN4 [Cercospora beticola]
MAGSKWKVAAAAILAFALAVEGCNKCEKEHADHNVITVVVHASCGIPSKTTTLYPPPTPPSVTDVPPCGRECVTPGQYGGCAEGDVKCICKNKSYLEGLSTCVARKCTGRGDCQSVIDFATKVCGSVGVFDLPKPSCAPPPPSYTDVPSCAQRCVVQGSYGGCAEGDVACICRNTPYLQDLTGCVSRECTGTSCQGVVDFAKNVCGSVGVTSLPIPSCAATTTARPPTVTDVPNCAQRCVTQGQYGGCAEGDVGCICRNTAYLNGLTDCVSQNCNSTGCSDVVNFASSVCGSVGVTSLPMPSCAASTSSARPPTVTDVPSCAQICVTAGSYGGCAEGDVNCICRNTAYLDGLTNCVSQNCNATGCAEVASFAGNLCSSVGVTSLPMPSSCGIPPVTYTTTQQTVVVTTASGQTVTTTQQTVIVTTAPGQTVTLTAPTTVVPPAETVTASTAVTVTVISTAPASTVSVTETYSATTTQQGPTETATTIYVSTVQTTVERTVTLPASSYTTTIVESGTTYTQVTTAPGSTIVETTVAYVPTTVYSIGTNTQTATLQRTVTSTAPGGTVTATQQVTSVRVSTAPASTIVTTLRSTIVSTAPAQTVVSTFVSTYRSTIISTAPAQTIVSTAPGQTIVTTRVSTAPAQTIVSTFVSTYRSTIISTASPITTTYSVTRTIPASTVTVTSTTTPPAVTVTVSTSIVQTTTQRTSVVQTTTYRTTVSPPGAPPGYVGPTTTTTTTTTTRRTTTSTAQNPPGYTPPAPPPPGYTP